jgi:predicted short-subunit dehydrogenase-like oxidoreductase (DUF2520 family)
MSGGANRPVYGLLGSGRLARHLAYWFAAEGLAARRWARAGERAANTIDPTAHPDTEERLRLTVAPCSHVLVLLSDDAITPFIARHAYLKEKTLIHCSGALAIPGVNGAHPLMTFGPELYGLARYRAIPFVTDAEGLPFPELFPGLPNPHYPLAAERKALYHACCVVSGNFTGLLWERVFAEFATLGLPKQALLPYMEQVFANLACADGVVTGPLVRRDMRTIGRNLAALEGNPLKDVYEAFLRLAGITPMRQS